MGNKPTNSCKCTNNYIICEEHAKERICRLYNLLLDAGIEDLPPYPTTSSMIINISSERNIRASIIGRHTHGTDWNPAHWNLNPDWDYYEILCSGAGEKEEYKISEELGTEDGYIGGYLRVNTEDFVDLILTMRNRYV
jgi:hypothetical protein